MDRRRKRLLFLVVLLILIVIALIGEIMSDRVLQFYLGMTIFGTVCLVALALVAVAFMGAS